MGYTDNEGVDGMIPFPDKKYNIIYADPAWSYNSRATTPSRMVVNKYDVMPTKEIASLPVRDICEKDCVLFMWGYIG